MIAPAVVLLVMAVTPAFAQDREPLVVGGDGTSTTVDDVIDSTTPDQLLSDTVVLPNANPHTCHVSASADARFGGDGLYVFGLRDGGLSTDLPVAASERLIEFTNNPDNDEGYKPVATNYTFSGLTGSHTFRFSARKNAAAAADMTVASSSLSIVCVRETL